MSTTPRTDAECDDAGIGGYEEAYKDMRDLARQIEHETADLKSQIAAHEAVRDACFAELPGCQVWGDVPGEIADLKAKLARAQAAVLYANNYCNAYKDGMHWHAQAIKEAEESHDG